MSKRTLLIAILALSLLFAFQAFAADQSSSSSTDMSGQSSANAPSSSSSSSDMSSQQQGAQQQGAFSAQMDKTSLIGKRVQSSDGRSIGRVTDAVTDPNTNSIAYAIVSYQGKSYPVPFNALSMSSGTDQLVLNQSKDKFTSAPTIASGQQPDLQDQQLNSQIHQFYGVSPSWQAPGTSSSQGSSMGGATSGGSMGGQSSGSSSQGQSSGSTPGGSSSGGAGSAY